MVKRYETVICICFFDPTCGLSFGMKEKDGLVRYYKNWRVRLRSGAWKSFLPLVENLRTFKLKSVTTFMKKFIEQVWSHHQNSWKVPTNGCIDLVLILVEKVIPAKSFASHLYNFLGQSIFVVHIISLLKIMLQKNFFCPLLDIF